MSNIEKVLTVFRGIESRDPDLTTKYMNPEKYKQHNPHVADGVEGLREYIRQFPRENHHLKVVRTFEDGLLRFRPRGGADTWSKRLLRPLPI
jgi:predicted SnoaL-like aldol condensation-catalyzing enzyme